MKFSFKILAVLMAVLFVAGCVATTALADPATADEIYSITFAVKGEGTVVVTDRQGNLIAEIKGDNTETINVDCNITISTKEGIDLKGNIRCSDTKCGFSDDGKKLYLNCAASKLDSTVTVTFPKGSQNSSEPESSKPESSNESSNTSGGNEPDPNAPIRTVTFDIGFGGSVVLAGENVSVSNQSRNFVKRDGDKIEFTATANAGYEIETFTVGGEAVPAEGSSYTYYLNVTQTVKIVVTFRSLNGNNDNENEISAADINWESESISINLIGGKKVKRDVLNRISALNPTAGKYVEFISENGVIYVPYGGLFVGMGEVADMSVSKITSGTEFDAVANALSQSGEKFGLFGINTAGNLLPENTLVAFKLGTEFANKPVSLHSLSNGNLSLNQNGTEVVSADGLSQKFIYNNEPVLVCVAAAENNVTVEIIIPASGGNASPAGVNLVNKGDSFSYTVNAAECFVIKEITQNGVALEGVAGKSVYKGALVADGDYTVNIQFEAVEITDDGGSNTGTIVVVLVIIIVALLGAAALFVVKWKQEKF